MTWVKLDDGFPEHEKVIELSDRAFRLHVTALCRCSKNLTDGLINDRDVNICCAVIDAKRPGRYVQELVEAGLWVTCAGGGYEIKDYLFYNPDAETVKARRNQRREAGKQGGKARWGSESLDEPLDESNGFTAKPPAQTPDPRSVKPNRPVGERSGVHNLEAHAAAVELFEEIRQEHRDSGTKHVVLAYVQELEAEDFRIVRRELVKRRHRVRNDGRWVNGALLRRAAKRAANKTSEAA